MVKIAWNMIVKGDDKEAEMLDQCLSFLDGYVDGMFIAITHKKGEEINKKTIEVCEKHKATWLPFEWVYDFAKARNFAMKMIPADYTHWGWCDSDDGIRGIENLRVVLEENPDIDLFNMDYLFHFDSDKNTDVVHQKTMIIKNNNCVEWHRPLHEDFKELRATTRKFIKGIERIHLADEPHFEQSKLRNVEISKIALDNNPGDPGFMWNYAQSLYGIGKFEEAKKVYLDFMDISSSEEEKYLVYIRLGVICDVQGNKQASLNYFRMAIGLRPNYPDAYHALGRVFYNQGLYQQAVDMISTGLTKKPPYRSIIVYNPREYDFEPLMLLAKIFYSMSRPDQAVTCLEACKKMQPKNTTVLKMLKLLKKDKKFFDLVIEKIKYLEKIAEYTPHRLEEEFLNLKPDIQAHPGICALRNKYIVKKESSGKDLVYYAGYTELPFSPSYAKKKGIGGSEEAIINLSKEWKKLGWNVTVYCNTGDLGEESDGVKYLPFWMWNYRDKQDVTILWRQTGILDKVKINSTKIFVDVHDVMPEGEFGPERLEKIDKVMVKTKFHRSLFPNIPDNKIEIVPNGMAFELFDQKIEKKQKLIVNTSSPDRSLDVLPKLFKKIKERVPDAVCKWCYGFDLFDKVHSNHPAHMKWSDETKKALEEAGIENLGRLTQKETAKLYLEANILAYPTEFAEIDCITVKKAQACGCLPITTNFAALEESVKTGIKIASNKNKDNWCPPNKFSFGLENEEAQNKWVEAVVEQLNKPIEDRSEMKSKMEEFRWDIISRRWNDIML